MGLDMFLEKHIYVGAQYEHRKITGKIEILMDGKPVPIRFDQVGTVIEEVGYWRKANAIHQWFVENVQDGEDDCEKYYVSIESLQKLYDTCGEVLEDHDKAPVLLPTQEGFFFGGTEYDDYYFKDLQSTRDIILPILEEAKEDYITSISYYYQSSW